MNPTEDVASPQQEKNTFGWLLPVIIIGVLILAAFLWFGRNNSARPIKPLVPTQTPSALQSEYAPISLEFADLGEDPVQFRDQRIQITGRFSKIELPSCRPYSGPQIEWGLVHDSLQMNAVGYEQIVRGLPDNTEMTVEGVWTFYEGSVGCGKESTEQNGIWYLKVEHILHPNPIVAGDTGSGSQINIIGDEDDSGTEPIAAPTNPVEDEEAGDTAATPVATIPSIGSTATATSTPPPALNSTPTATTTQPESTTQPTATPVPVQTEEATVAPDSTSTPTPTATEPSAAEETETPPPTPTTGSPGNPPAPTATPGDGYPPPGGGGGGYP